MPSGKEINVFELATAEAHESEAKNVDEDRTILMIGSKSAGKSSVICRFLDKPSEAIKPTMALEYTYGRKARSNDLGKDIVHIWELGGGANLTKLAETVVTTSTLKSLSVAIVIDLSKPNELWFTLETLLNAVKARVDRVLSDLVAKESRLPQYLKKKAWAKMGDDHADKDLLDPFKVPLTIIGTKYDLFQDFESEKRKLICKTLRYFAHVNGASMLFTSDKDETLIGRAKVALSHMAFKTGSSRSCHFDHAKALAIPVGADSMAQIGPPPVPKEELAKIRNPLEMWRKAFVMLFPPDEAAQEAALTQDPGTDPKFREAAVDEARGNKNEELERYKRNAERRARETAARHASSSHSKKDSTKSKSSSSSRSKSSSSKGSPKPEKKKSSGNKEKSSLNPKPPTELPPQGLDAPAE